MRLRQLPPLAAAKARTTDNDSLALANASFRAVAAVCLRFCDILAPGEHNRCNQVRIKLPEMMDIQQVTANAIRAGGVPHASEGQSRIGALQAVPSVLSEVGVDPSAFFSQLDIAPRMFANPDNLIAK